MREVARENAAVDVKAHKYGTEGVCRVCGGGPCAPCRAHSQVFINEIHYDNTGADAGEAVEIAGPAGFVLVGWSLVFYNGNGGAVYNTVALSGTLTDQANGFGFAVFPLSGIQHGAPDGLALVDPSDSVVQFLSYEGIFVAVDGPAVGMTSTDIGVAETGSTPVGFSLQLSGTGTSAADFMWAAAAQNTFGAVNAGQSFGGDPTSLPSPVPSPSPSPSPKSNSASGDHSGCRSHVASPGPKGDDHWNSDGHQDEWVLPA